MFLEEFRGQRMDFAAAWPVRADLPPAGKQPELLLNLARVALDSQPVAPKSSQIGSNCHLKCSPPSDSWNFLRRHLSQARHH
jgi:hypothetical protein